MSSRAPRSAAEAVEEDTRFMAAALNLARRGWGRVAPNPAVGALIVKDGILVGRGATADGGRPHAEVLALRQARERARGATLYVTLEPCSHHGRNPPCADAIVAAGVVRVVSALEDPDRRVAGTGHRRLREAGIDVKIGVLAEAARRANLGHVLRATHGRPMLTLKLAETVNGYAAAPTGATRLKITGAVADGRVHMLRALHDAVLVGIGTARADDPLLNVRLAGMESRKPLRIVLDAHLKLAPKSRLAASAREYPTLAIGGKGTSAQAAARLVETGIEIERVGVDAAGRIDLGAALAFLGARGLTRVFCEGGPRLSAAIIAQGFADEVLLLRSDQALGTNGVPALDPASRAALADPDRYRLCESGRIGTDAYAHYERIL